MRCLKRNEQTFYYALYTGAVVLKDSAGNETSELHLTYAEPVKARGNISPAMGKVEIEIFGTSIDYDKVIIMCEPDCPIDEHTVLFIDKAVEHADAPVVDDEGETTPVIPPEIELQLIDPELINPEPEPWDETQPPIYDYSVVRVARSLNSVAIAVKKVSVSA